MVHSVAISVGYLGECLLRGSVGGGGARSWGSCRLVVGRSLFQVNAGAVESVLQRALELVPREVLPDGHQIGRAHV